MLRSSKVLCKALALGEATAPAPPAWAWAARCCSLGRGIMVHRPLQNEAVTRRWANSPARSERQPAMHSVGCTMAELQRGARHKCLV